MHLINKIVQWIGQRQLQDVKRNINVLGLGESYIRELTVDLFPYDITKPQWVNWHKGNHSFLWDVITHLCPNSSGGLAQHGCEITNNSSMWMELVIHALHSMLNGLRILG